MDCLAPNGIDGSWHMVGLHVSGSKKDSFMFALLIGECLMSSLVCYSGFRCRSRACNANVEESEQDAGSSAGIAAASANCSVWRR